MSLNIPPVSNYLPSFAFIPAAFQKTRSTLSSGIAYVSPALAARLTVRSVSWITVGVATTLLIIYLWRRAMSPKTTLPAPKPRQILPPAPPELLPFVFQAKQPTELKKTQTDQPPLDKLAALAVPTDFEPVKLAENISKMGSHQPDPLLSAFFTQYEARPDKTRLLNVQALYENREEIVKTLLRTFHEIEKDSKKSLPQQQLNRLSNQFEKECAKLAITIETNAQYIEALDTNFGIPAESLAPFFKEVNDLSLAGFVEELQNLIDLCPKEKQIELVEFAQRYLMPRAAKIANVEEFVHFLQTIDKAFLALEAAGLENLANIAQEIRNEAIHKMLGIPVNFSLQEFHQFNHDIKNLDKVNTIPFLTHALVGTVQNFSEKNPPLDYFLENLPFITIEMRTHAARTLLRVFNEDYGQTKHFDIDRLHACLKAVLCLLSQELSDEKKELVRNQFEALPGIINENIHYSPKLTAMKVDFDALNTLLGSTCSLEIDNDVKNDQQIANEVQRAADEEASLAAIARLQAQEIARLQRQEGEVPFYDYQDDEEEDPIPRIDQNRNSPGFFGVISGFFRGIFGRA